MSFLYTAVAFLLALGPLIIFHELGHYWVARACGVKVLRFSLGIGKVVWSRRMSEADILRTIEDYATTAALARDAGYDGV